MELGHLLTRSGLTYNLPCSGPVTHSGEILTTGKSHGKKPDRFSLNDDTDVKKPSRLITIIIIIIIIILIISAKN